MVFAALSAMLAVSNLSAGGQMPRAPSVGAPALRGPINGTQTMAAVSRVALGGPACQCEASNPSWVKTKRTQPKCVFIDLGAADGNSFQHFLGNGYGSVANCPSGGSWEAMLVEANPRFKTQLQQQEATYPGSVRSFTSTAIFSCDGETTFYLDTSSHEHNYWGSSLSDKASDVQRSGMEHVPVKLLNLNRLIYENTIPDDWVGVKMDIEGAEWDVLPCLANSPAASLIDTLFMEVHGAQLSLTGTTQAQFDAAKAALQAKGVQIPPYFSHTL